MTDLITTQPSRHITLFVSGQSNQQGAATDETGRTPVSYRALSTGEKDPLPGVAQNTGGSAWPFLIDLEAARGVSLHVRNNAIGSTSALHWTGCVGGVVTSAPSSYPVTGTFTYGYTGNNGIGLNEGDAGFDPFQMLAYQRQYIQADVGVKIGLWANGEADAGTSYDRYKSALKSIARYNIASGLDAFFIGVTCKGTSLSVAQIQAEQATVADAIRELRAEGLNVLKGADLYEVFGNNPPVHPELATPSARVHLTLDGQRIHAMAWDRVFQAAGY